MKLRYYKQNIELKLLFDKINHLVIEHEDVFDDFIVTLKKAGDKLSEDIAILDDGYDKLDFSKLCYMVYSPLDCHYERRDIQKKLYVSLARSIEESALVEDFISVRSNLMLFIEKLKMLSDYTIDAEEDYAIDYFLKNVNIQLKNPEGRFINRLSEFSKTMHRLLDKKLFIVVGCAYYLTENDYKELLKFSQYEDLWFLFVDGRQLDTLNLPINEYIIDRDLCLLH